MPAPLGDSNDEHRHFDPVTNFYKVCVVWIHRHRDDNTDSVDSVTVHDAFRYTVRDAVRDTVRDVVRGESWLDIDRADAKTFERVPEAALQVRVEQWLREQRATVFPFAYVRED
jgi:hypothetical protein